MVNVRRIVTGHQGAHAVIWRDGAAQNQASRVPGLVSTLVWSTEAAPADYLRDEDMGERKLGIQPPAGGTRFSVLDIAPGNAPYMHRTDSIDYVICVAGEIEMDLDSGETVKLLAGDVMVQRGTSHSWVNRSDKPCRLAVVLIDGQPKRAA
jgi:quercetin dioxygenase-like cupin family protein